jgi:hypothetical protein
MEYYLVIEKNEIVSFAGKWMETIMLSKIRHIQNDIYHIFFSHMYTLDNKGMKVFVGERRLAGAG